VQRHAADTSILVLQQIHDQCVLEHLDTGIFLDGGQRRGQRRDQCTGDLFAGRVSAGMGDPVTAVTTLSRQRDLAVRPTVELHSESRELTNTSRALGDQDAHGLFIADACAGDQGVEKMLVRGVGGIQSCSDSTLGPLRRPFRQQGLGHQQHTVDPLAQSERGGQTGNPGADDDDVGGSDPPGFWRHQPRRDAQRRDGEGHS